MEPKNENHEWDWDKNNPDFYHNLVSELPAIIYLNELDRSGDICSFRNIYMNQPGLDFIGNTQQEICSGGYDFFKEMIHPTDLEILLAGLKDIFLTGSPMHYCSSIRIKPTGKTEYTLFKCFKKVLKTFDDGTVKKVVVAAFELTPPDVEFDLAMKEIRRHECKAKVDQLTERETQILHLIVKGKTDREIAAIVCLSYKTIRTHHHNIICKLGVHKLAELVAMAVESGDY